MATVGTLVVNLLLNSAGLSSGLAKAQAEIGAWQASVSGAAAAPAKGFPVVAHGAQLAALAIAGMGAASVHAAADFEYEMMLVHTHADASRNEIKAMTAEIMNMAPSVQAGPEELAKALFHIESVGYRGAKGLEILEFAAKGAAVGAANLEDVTNALLAVVTSGIKGVDSMSEAMGVLNGIVGTGNIRMEELASSMSSGIMSTARTFGLAVQDVGAALATMSDQGIPAEEGTTRLRMSIAMLGAPTKLATQQLNSIGLTYRSLADEMRGEGGLIGALKLLKTHMEGAGLDAAEQANLLKLAFGGARSSSGILTLLNSLDLYQRKLETIKEQQASFPEDFAAEAETAAAHFKNLGAATEVLAISIGNGLMPVVVPIADFLGQVEHNTKLLTVAFIALAAVMTAMAIKAFVGMAVSLAQTLAGIGAQVAAYYGLASAASAAASATTAASAATAAAGATTAAAGMSVSGTVGHLASLAAAATTAGTAASGAAGQMSNLAATTATVGTTAAGAAPAVASVGAAATGTAAATTAASRTMSAAWVGLLGPIGLLILAISLYATNQDRVAQGLRVLQYHAAGFQQVLADIISMVPGMEGVGKAMRASAEAARSALVGEMRKAEDAINAASDPQFDLEAMKKDIEDQVKNLDFSDLTETLVQKYGTSFEAVKVAAAESGAEAMLAMAKEITAHQDAPVEAFKSLLGAMETALTPEQEVARAIGMLTSAELQAGLASGDPAILAWAEGLRDSLTERLDEITLGAYTAHLKLQEMLAETPVLGAIDDVETRRGLQGMQLAAAQGAKRWDEFKPKVSAVTAEMKKLNAQLKEAENSKAASALSTAFSQIQSAAHQYFDYVHRARLQAIDDAVREKNAILDAKAALNQSPVTAMQRALDAQRKQIQEWRLRQAVATAQDPEAYRDAVLALQDFLAQSHIDEMQQQVDAAGEVIDAQKEANDARADQLRDAEDERYRIKVATFDRELQLLEDALLNQKITWQEGEEKILGLLGSYGVTYGNIGSSLGNVFGLNLNDAIDAAIEALKLKLPSQIDSINTIINGGFQGQISGPPGGGGFPAVNTPTSGFSVGGSWSPYEEGISNGTLYGPSAYPTSPTGSTSPTAGTYDYAAAMYGGKLGSFATGNWNVLKDQLAMIHEGEMVVPSDAADMLRDVAGTSTGRDFGKMVSTRARADGGIGQGAGGGGTLILKVGEEKWAELTDQQLAIQDSIYGPREPTLSSRR